MIRHPLVEIIKQWGGFEEAHPDGTSAEFCQYFLEQKKDDQHLDSATDSEFSPMGFTNALAVLINRVNRYMSFFARKIMKDLPVDNSDDFFYLAILHFEGQKRRTDLINQNISEFTSGTNIINRLLKKKLIEEFIHPGDARAKIVIITPAGRLWINDCMGDMVKVNELSLMMLTEDEKRAATAILSKADKFHTIRYNKLKGMGAKEIWDFYQHEQTH